MCALCNPLWFGQSFPIFKRFIDVCRPLGPLFVFVDFRRFLTNPSNYCADPERVFLEYLCTSAWLIFILGNEPRPKNDFWQVVRKVSYCGVAMLQEEEESDSKRIWTLQEPPFPPLTHCSNARFDIKALSLEWILFVRLLPHDIFTNETFLEFLEFWTFLP